MLTNILYVCEKGNWMPLLLLFFVDAKLVYLRLKYQNIYDYTEMATSLHICIKKWLLILNLMLPYICIGYMSKILFGSPASDLDHTRVNFFG